MHIPALRAHHIEHWAQGGETSLASLMLLCEARHSAVHEGGFRIEKDYRDRWFFRRPGEACGAGVRLPAGGRHG